MLKPAFLLLGGKLDDSDAKRASRRGVSLVCSAYGMLFCRSIRTG